MNFQKPENALRRAEELLGVGQPDHALQVLHHTIGHRKFRSQGWDIVQEQIMLQYVALCVDLQKLKVAREGLHQYRSIAQLANAESLGKVLKELRDRAEAKLAQAKQNMENIKLEEISDDLEAEESPESLMLSMLAIDVRDDNAKRVHSALRMCWETYKMILDIVRTTPKQEKVYHETAQRGLEFCLANSRPQEFKRLCEVIRNHYMLLQKNRGKADYEPLLRQDIHLETRLEQLKVASQLQLWRESYQTAEDLFNLGIHDQLQRTASPTGRAKFLASLAVYFEKLAQIFWVSDLLLFHAQARMRYMLHTRMYNKAQSEASLTSMASIAVLSVLSIPLSFANKSMENTSLLEHYRKLSGLLGHTNVPSRDGMKAILASRSILSGAAEAVQALYKIMEVEEVHPQVMCKACLPLIEEITKDEALASYVGPLKHVIFNKLVVQLSQVYSSMSVEYFTANICPESFLPWIEAEKTVVVLVRSGLVQLRLDYAKNAIYFGSATRTSEAIVRDELSSFSRQMAEAVSLIEAKGRAEAAALRRLNFYQNINEKMRIEGMRLQQRNEQVTQRREQQVVALRQQEDAKKQLEKEKQQKEERLEIQRRAEEQKRRETERRKEELNKEKLDAAETIVEEVKKLAMAAAKMAAKQKDDDTKEVLIKGIPLSAVDVEKAASGFIGLEDFEKAHAEIRNRERQEKASVRRLQAKKVDHLVRALLSEELKVLDVWEEDQERKDIEYLDRCREKQAAEHKIEKECFLPFVPFKQRFVAERMEERKKEFEVKRHKQIARLTEQLKKEKITRALQRKNTAEEAEQREQERQEEEASRALEEKAKQEAEEKKQRMQAEDEERQRKIKEQEEKQRKKEQEIEERLQQEKAAAGAPRGALPLRTADRGDRGPERDVRGADEADSQWSSLRSRRPPVGEGARDDRRPLRGDREDLPRGPGNRFKDRVEAPATPSSRADALRDDDTGPRVVRGVGSMRSGGARDTPSSRDSGSGDPAGPWRRPVGGQ